MGTSSSQVFPPDASLTEQNLPNQKGKVFVVTGGASGVGYEVASILFQAGGKVYIAGRSESNARKAIDQMWLFIGEDSASIGELEYLSLVLEYLSLVLDDLSSIKESAEAFMSKESRLDVLFNNAGVSLPPVGSVSKQGYELQMATNCLGPFLFTQFLLPTLQETAKSSPPGSIRVVWTSSLVVDISAPPGGVNMAELMSPPKNAARNYTTSKVGNWFLASELVRRVGEKGILSVTQNPGNLKTNGLRHMSSFMQLVVRPMLYKANYGAYTELWAGLSPELTMEMNGAYVIPWGRVHPTPRKDILDALKSAQEGGTDKQVNFGAGVTRLLLTMCDGN